MSKTLTSEANPAPATSLKPSLESLPNHSQTVLSAKPGLDRKTYDELYQLSLNQPEQFWDKQATEFIDWLRPYQEITSASFNDIDPQTQRPHGHFTWFKNGGLNACHNCLDRWALQHPNRTAIIWIADDEKDSFELTYAQVLEEVCRLANALKAYGIKKGDTVAIYLPMIPAAAMALLACARIGAIHSVIFAGFSADSLRDRIQDARSRVVITSDEARRGGKIIPTKRIVDQAINTLDPSLDFQVSKVIVFSRACKNSLVVQHPCHHSESSSFTHLPSEHSHSHPGRDVWWHSICSSQSSECSIEVMDSEDPLFILYTSGSTGKPKGLVHTTAGYLLGAAMTVKYVFDLRPDDRFACMADVGWITGHTYIVYGPLMNGITTTIFESTPVFPTASRYWQAVEKYKLTQLYTAPTAIRLLKKMGNSFLEGHDLSSLRTIGSVGEPINPEAWQWYSDMVGKNQCTVVDTYWQTETGSHVITPIPGAIKTKPGSATLPFFGIEAVLLDPMTGEELRDRPTEGVLAFKRPWPSMARTIYGHHSRFVETYLNVFKGYYFTGDGASIDEDGYFWIKGRVDDVLNVSGHRLSTSEIETAFGRHACVAESAVVGAPDETTGQSIHGFVCLKPEWKNLCSSEQSPHHSAREEQDYRVKKIQQELIQEVRKMIGPFAHPKKIYLVEDLPKTRSGKIMRRILRKIVANEIEDLGDLSTLNDPQVVQAIIAKM